MCIYTHMYIYIYIYMYTHVLSRPVSAERGSRNELRHGSRLSELRMVVQPERPDCNVVNSAFIILALVTMGQPSAGLTCVTRALPPLALRKSGFWATRNIAHFFLVVNRVYFLHPRVPWGLKHRPFDQQHAQFHRFCQCKWSFAKQR